MMPARTFPPALATVLSLVAAMGCHDAQEPTSERTRTSGPRVASSLPGLIVSNPVLTGGDHLVYVALPPWILLDAVRTVIENRRTGAQATVAMESGGFDPVALAAAAGDTLDLRVERLSLYGVRDFMAVVPTRRSPVVVRTDPGTGLTQVPRDAAPRVVFSEPIDAATLTTSAVPLLRDSTPVIGTLAFDDAANLTIRFQPAEPLAAGTWHTLTVTQGLADLDGDALEKPVMVGFATRYYLSAIVAIYERVIPPDPPDLHSRYVLDQEGGFELQIESEASGAGAYTGEYTRADSVITFAFDAWGIVSQWLATGTLRGDSLFVAYNDEMKGADFDDEVYVRPATTLTGGWGYRSPLPAPRWQPGVTALNGIVYVAGGVADGGTGWVAPPEILAYDPAGDTWGTAGMLPQPVRGPALAAVGDRVYVVGGCKDDPWEPIADLQILDPASGTVEPGPPMSVARCELAVAVLDGRIHAIGGLSRWDEDYDLGEPSVDHEVFDPATGAWSRLAPLPVAQVGHGAAVVDGKIYVVGGLGYSLQIYDPATDSWTQQASPRVRFSIAAVTLGGKVFLFGGSEPPEPPNAMVQRFDPATGEWEQVTPMAAARAGPGAAVVGASVYVIGGSGTGSASGALSVNERFTPP